MRLSRTLTTHLIFSRTGVVAGIFLIVTILLSGVARDLRAQPASNLASHESKGGAAPQFGPPASVCEPSTMGSPFVPVDSWIYPALFRLYGLGFVDHVFLGMRPWTRSSINRMLEDVAARIEDANPGPETNQAQELYDALAHELRYDMAG